MKKSNILRFVPPRIDEPFAGKTESESLSGIDKPFVGKAERELLWANGYQVSQDEPLKVVNMENGSMATGEAAKMVVAWFLYIQETALASM